MNSKNKLFIKLKKKNGKYLEWYEKKTKSFGGKIGSNCTKYTSENKNLKKILSLLAGKLVQIAQSIQVKIKI